MTISLMPFLKGASPVLEVEQLLAMAMERLPGQVFRFSALKIDRPQGQMVIGYDGNTFEYIVKWVREATDETGQPGDKEADSLGTGTQGGGFPGSL